MIMIEHCLGSTRRYHIAVNALSWVEELSNFPRAAWELSATVPWHKWSVHRVFPVPWGLAGMCLEGTTTPRLAWPAWPAWTNFVLFSTLISDRFLEPKLIQDEPKMKAKIHQKSIQNLIDFLIDFCMRFWSQNVTTNTTTFVQTV